MRIEDFFKGMKILPLSDDGRLEMIHALKLEICKISPVDLRFAKETLAEQLATLMVHQRVLVERHARNELPPEEAKAIPGVASNIHRLIKTMGLAKLKDDGFGFDE